MCPLSFFVCGSLLRFLVVIWVLWRNGVIGFVGFYGFGGL